MIRLIHIIWATLYNMHTNIWHRVSS